VAFEYQVIDSTIFAGVIIVPDQDQEKSITCKLQNSYNQQFFIEIETKEIQDSEPKTEEKSSSLETKETKTKLIENEYTTESS
jgi:hypothetical protein